MASHWFARCEHDRDGHSVQVSVSRGLGKEKLDICFAKRVATEQLRVCSCDSYRGPLVGCNGPLQAVGGARERLR